jgi:hypothetical protein
MQSYHVIVRRDPEDARFWLADVDGLDGAHTSSRSLATLDRYVREVIILAADLPDEAEDDLQLEWTYQTGDTRSTGRPNNSASGEQSWSPPTATWPPTPAP